MSPHSVRRVSLAATAIGLSYTALSAQEREFTQSRDWHIPARGEHELEIRSFIDTTHGDFRSQIEYEYGVTGYFAFEPGFEIAENADDDYEVEAADVELRFAFGEYRRGAWLPGLNVEYEHPFDDEESSKLEFKGVLSRYGERDDITVNLNLGKELEHERETESELTAGWVRDLGLATEDGRWLWRLGLEAVEDFEEHDLRAGPLVNLRANRHLNFLASYVLAIDDRDDGNFDELAFLVEIEL